MSKIYTDLNTVLTPYATAIKKNASDITSLNGSLEDVTEKVGGMKTLTFSDLYGLTVESDTSPYSPSFHPLTDEETNFIVGQNGSITLDSAITKRELIFFGENVSGFEFTLPDSVQNHGMAIIISDFGTHSPQSGCSARALIINGTKGYRGNGYVKKTASGSVPDIVPLDNPQWTSSVRIKKIKVERKESSYLFTFTDIDGTVTENEFTDAQLSITGDVAKHMGLYLKQAFANQNLTFVESLNVITKSQFITEQQASNSPLYGHTWEAWGDSLTDASAGGRYVSLISDVTGCTGINCGVTGNRMGMIRSRFGSYEDTHADYITVFGGMNDYLGNMGSPATAISSFRNTVQSFITDILTASPLSKIGFITPMLTDAPQETPAEGTTTTMEDYVNAIVEVCRANNVPVLDLYHSSGWYGTTSGFTSVYYNTSSHVHPNQAGQALLAEKIQRFMESL